MSKKNNSDFVERFVFVSKSQHLEFPTLESLNSYVDKFKDAFPGVDLSYYEIYKLHIFKIK